MGGRALRASRGSDSRPAGLFPVGAVRTEESEEWEVREDGRESILADLMHVHHLLVFRLDRALRPFDLSFAGFEVLVTLLFASGSQLSVSELSRVLQVHGTSVSSGVARLERSGLVRRCRVQADGRIVLVRLTRKGEERVVEAAGQVGEQVFAQLGISERQMADLIGVLGSLRANAGDFVRLRSRGQ